MSFALDEKTIDRMIAFVEGQMHGNGCDHTHRFTSQWSRENQINWDDLLDWLEPRGAFCDCEVVLNLEGASLNTESGPISANPENRWLLPPDFNSAIETTNRILVARGGVGKNNYALEGEWLVPASVDAKPRKRVRKSVNFFIGIESGLPTEIGFIQAVPQISLSEFTKKIRKSNIPELMHFDDRVAAFFAQMISAFPEGVAVGIDVMDRVGIATKHKELNIYRVRISP